MTVQNFLMVVLAFGCVACSGKDWGTAEEKDAPEWIREFKITEKTLLAEFDKANLSGFEEPKFTVEKPNGEISIWRYRRPYVRTGRFNLHPGDKLRAYLEIPTDAYSHRGGGDTRLWRQVNVHSNLFTDRLSIAPLFVRSHLKIGGCEHFSGSQEPGEGDVAAIVSFSPNQFEESLASLDALADKTAEFGNRLHLRVHRSDFTGSRELLEVLSDASWEINPEDIAYFKYSWSDNTGEIVMDRDSLRGAFHEYWY